MNEKKTMNERIAEARAASSLTQTQVGKMIGVEANTISMYERGERTPSVGIIASLARVLHVSADYLIFGEERKLINASGLDDREYAIISDLTKYLTDKNMQDEKK